MGRKRDKQPTARRLLDKLTYAIARALPGAAIEVGGAFVGLPPGVTTVAKAVTDKLLSLRAEQKTREALLKADVTAAETHELSKRFSAMERALLTAAGLPVEAPDNLAELQDQVAGGKEERLERAVEILFAQAGRRTDDVDELARIIVEKQINVTAGDGSPTIIVEGNVIGGIRIGTAAPAVGPPQALEAPALAAAPPEAAAAWPEPCIRPGTPRTAEHFVGRAAELGQLRRAVRAAKSVICVVGMAGQGKSALVAEWYRRRGNGLDDRGLFWCRPYDTGYTYAAFLADVLPYVAGAAYDPRQYPKAEDQTRLLCAVLRQRPTLIVLDGAERWLRLWAADRDAAGSGASPADRAAAEDALGILLTDAPSWDSGSALLLTTRALPAALDDAPKVTIGAGRPAGQRELAGLDDDAATALLERLGVQGERDDLLAAAREYANHPLALRVLAGLLVKLYGGDVGRRPEIDVLVEDRRERGLRHLLERIVEHRADDLPLLGLLAACLVPAPIALLAGVLRGDEKAMRARLAELADWRLVSFDGTDAGLADLHALIRQDLLARATEEETAERRKQIARWFGARPLPEQPGTLGDVRPLLLATEHALAADDPGMATHYLFGRPAGRHYRTLHAWLLAFGHLARDVELVGACIERYETLVYREGRGDLRKDLAMGYVGRGLALADQGELSAAVADYDKAVAILEALVHDEGRRELAFDLARWLFNRALAQRVDGRRVEARRDMERGWELTDAAVADGQLHLVPLFLRMTRQISVLLLELGEAAEAARRVNEALAYAAQVLDASGPTELLRREAAGSYARLAPHVEELTKAGLDVERFDDLARRLGVDRAT